jgi:hypothetical protein
MKFLFYKNSKIRGQLREKLIKLLSKNTDFIFQNYAKNAQIEGHIVDKGTSINDVTAFGGTGY